MLETFPKNERKKGAATTRKHLICGLLVLARHYTCLLVKNENPSASRPCIWVAKKFTG